MDRKYLQLMALAAARQRMGHRRFRFVWHWGREQGLYRIGVRGRRDGFRAELQLRPGSGDARVFQQIFLDEQYRLPHPRLQAAFAAIRASGKKPLILDLGANIGLASLYFSAAWPGAKILAVEPEAGNLEMLRRNWAGAAAGAELELVAGAVDGEDGRVRIVDPQAATAAFRTARGGAIAAYALATLVRLAGEEVEPFVAKFDIEGAEGEVFSGNLDWLERFAAVVIEPHETQHAPGSFAPVLRAMAGRGWMCAVVGESIAFLRPGTGSVVGAGGDLSC